MNREEQLLVSICQSYLNGSALSIDPDTDTKEFYRIAKNHNLIGICHCVLSKNTELEFDKDTRAQFMDKFFDLVYIYTCQSNILNDIRGCFTKAGIKFIPFKGSVIRDYYPVPESRSMGDIDILIRLSDKDKAKKHLENIGFHLYTSNSNVDEYLRDNMMLEVHTRLTAEFGEDAFNDAFDNAQFNGFEGKFDDSYHFAYLITHIAGHLRYRSAGIGLILDLAVMLREREIDLNRVFEILDKIKLTAFAKTVISLCFDLFGYGERFVSDTQRLKEYFISNGVFGTMRNDNESTVSRLMEFGALEKEKGNSSSFALKLKLAFPPYRTLRKAPYIKFLNGHPWLLPLAWCCRFFYNLKHNRTHMLKTVSSINDKKTLTLAKEELEFFEEIGLI